MPITTLQLQKAAQELSALPAKNPRVSAADAAAELAPVLRQARENGYTCADIKQALARHGIALSEAAIKRASGRPRARAGSAQAAQSLPSTATPEAA